MLGNMHDECGNDEHHLHNAENLELDLIATKTQTTQRHPHEKSWTNRHKLLNNHALVNHALQLRSRKLVQQKKNIAATQNAKKNTNHTWQVHAQMRKAEKVKH
jgi:hypothetical protein